MLNLTDRALVIVDLETSGVNPFAHEVLAVGLVPMNDELPSTTVYVRPPEIRWSEYARKNFAKYEVAWEAQALGPTEACAQIEDYLATTFGGAQTTAIGHNIGFDIAFLRKLAFLGGRDELAGLSHRAIDTHTLLYVLAALGRVPDACVTSTGAFRQFGIEVPEAERHTALGDAQATRELLRKLLPLFVRPE
jgi:DNA polymerase III epsilon subunit-like protein